MPEYDDFKPFSIWFRQDLLSKAYYAKKTNSVTGREETTGGGFYNAGLHHALMTNPDAFPKNTLVKIDRHHPDHAHMFTEDKYPQYGIQSGDHIGNFDGFQIHVEKPRRMKDREGRTQYDRNTLKNHGYISTVQRDMTLPQSHGVTFADIAPSFGNEAGKAGYEKLTFTPFRESFDENGNRRKRARQRLFGPHIDKINEKLESAMPLILGSKTREIPMSDKES